jgi:hypothetical protein
VVLRRDKELISLNFNRYIYLTKLVLKSNIFLGLYHRFRRIIINDKIELSTLPEEIAGSFIIHDETLDTFSKYFASHEGSKSKLIELADNFCSGDVSIYHKSIFLDRFKIGNFEENRKRPGIYFKDLRFYWEIYRGKYLFNVGVAYRITNDEKYAVSLIEFIKKWKEYSPIVSDDVPYNGMEAALKLINLSWCDVFLRNNEHYNEEPRKILIYALIAHAEYIFKNYDISIYGLESNHSLTCGVGLIYASLLFPSYKNSRKWRALGERSLKRALRKQFSKDGVNFESSVHYHRFTFEMLLFLMAVYYVNGVKVAPDIEQSVKKIGEALTVLTHKNGYISKFGDNDGGKFLYDLGTIEEFNRLDYLKDFTRGGSCRSIEALLFSGVSELNDFLKGKESRTRVGGYIAYKGPDYSLIITANKIGTNGKGNHQHNDFLSFELYTANAPFIVDRWSSCYTGNREKRNNDRSTFFHNNIQIDGREIVPFDENRLFEMLGDVKVAVNNIKDGRDKWIADVQHNGYRNLERGPQLNRRVFEVLKDQNVIKIKDFLSGKGSHIATLNLLVPKRDWSLNRNEKGLVFTNECESFLVNSSMGVFNVSESSVSENFLNPIPAYLCSVSRNYRDKLETELVFTYNNRI